jgi:type VI secretion system protein ImpM
MREAEAAGGVQTGLFGKLPARGDFVRLGLPGGFVAAWDMWLQDVIAGSRARLGEGWLDAWLEAPIWRFALAPGLCGGGGALGLLLPSVDNVGRYFPLTLAAVWPARTPAASADTATAWLDACEAAGLAALEQDSGPEQVLAALPPPPAGTDGPRGGSDWRTAGAPRVAACHFTLAGLPDAACFTAMLDEQTLA